MSLGEQRELYGVYIMSNVSVDIEDLEEKRGLLFNKYGELVLFTCAGSTSETEAARRVYNKLGEELKLVYEAKIMEDLYK